MTTTLKEQLEQWIKQSSDNYELQLNEKLKRSGGDSALIEYAAEDFKAGARSILPMLLCAVEALQRNCRDNLHSAHYGDNICQSTSNGLSSFDALNKIKQMIEVK